MFGSQSSKVSILSNQEEQGGFLSNALRWQGSVTPRILPTIVFMCAFPLALIVLQYYGYALPVWEVTPFEYTGAVLGLVLVFRTNAGHDRWWEARRLWGGIVNQTRNLVVQSLNYGPVDSQWRTDMIRWSIVFAFAVKETLRGTKEFSQCAELMKAEELEEMTSAPHMALWVSDKIAALLQQSRLMASEGEKNLMHGFAFMTSEGQRAMLIDHLGACERILKTPMPLVYALKVRRFIFLFLVLLPLSLLNEPPIKMLAIYVLVAYPLLSLDRIGLELQNPFSLNNLSHLPLDSICESIKTHCLALQANAAKTI